MITLYFIQGINRTDTPTFSSTDKATALEEQTTYFSGKSVAVIENSFYPPKYRDRIAISSDDVNFNTTFNYLSLHFNDKYYYYFVDDIEYVNEELMNVDITMDVIQTYMFNITIDNCIVSRKSIKRWNSDGTINRDYLRENFSQGEFAYDSSDRGENKYGGYIIVATGTPTGVTDVTTTSTILLAKNLYNETTRQGLALKYYFLPLPVTDYTNLYVNNTSVTTTVQQLVLDQLTASTSVVDCFYVADIRCLSEIACNDTQSAIYYTFHTNYYNKCDVKVTLSSSVQLTGYVIRIGTLVDYDAGYPSELTKYITRSVDTFTENTSVNANFDYSYCPQLVDSNYYKWYFGEKTDYAQYPLEKLSTPTLYLSTFVDVLYQKRFYWITDTLSYNDEYMTMTTCTGNNSSVMQNNALNDWLAINKGTIAMSPVNAMLGSLDLDYNTTRTTTTSGGTRDTKNKYRSVGRRHKVVKSSSHTDISPMSTTSVSGRELAGVGLASTGLALAEGVANSLADFGNVVYTPNTINQSPTMTIFTDIPNWLYISYKVTDIEDCAKLYESLGYLVHEPYSLVGTWWINNLWTIRYYYNVLNFDDVNIHLEGCPSDTTTEELICDRLRDGLRLWRTYTKDSEVITYITMGQLYVWDNVEIASIS